MFRRRHNAYAAKSGMNELLSFRSPDGALLGGLDAVWQEVKGVYDGDESPVSEVFGKDESLVCVAQHLALDQQLVEGCGAFESVEGGHL